MNEEQLRALCEAQGIKVDARFDFQKIIDALPYLIEILKIFGLLMDEDKVG